MKFLVYNFISEDGVGRDLIKFMSSWFDNTTEDPSGPVLISVSISPTTPKDYFRILPLVYYKIR